MPKPKYDWTIAKQAYFDSPELSAEAFIRTFYALSPETALNGAFKKNMKGWREEKLEFRKKLAQNSNEKALSNPEVQTRVQRLVEYTEMIENSVSYMITSKRKKVVLNGEERIVLDRDLHEMKDIKIGYDILRLAIGKSTTNVGGDKDNSLNIAHTITQVNFSDS
jgi:hypothetical protein